MSQKFEKLKTLLKELFQLDQPDLDFGLYRIMHAKSAEVTQFLDKDLLPQVQQAFGLYKTADKAELEKELAKAIEQAQSLGADPETLPKVKELRARLANEAVDIGGLENEVYDHLFSFFRRYYSEGDFLAKRVYRPGVYAIPYEGEEVKLHWANRDQYYIKTSEYLRDYAFRLKPDDGAKPMRVHFRLVDAAEGEHGNVKAAEGKDRVFILAGEDFIAEEDGDLVLRFAYRPATLADWPESEHEGKKKPPAQKDLTASAVSRVLAVTDAAFTAWIGELGKPHVNVNGEKPGHSRLEGHLKRYTARNTFDYFIHKDLGGFLRRELDFYVKNEVMHLDDIESETAPRVEQYLSKIKVIRRIAGKVIDFLSQLEDFQKKLWLKKKFVVETQYCITLDRIPEEFYPEIAANDAQREEWVRLFAIDQIKKRLGEAGYEIPLTTDFLRTNRTLQVNTALFTEAFMRRLISSLSALDEQIDSVLVASDNFQAIGLLNARYASDIQCIYIDPPYNSSASEIIYKNDYKHSSWLSLLASRIEIARNLMKKSGVIQIAIDDIEQHRLHAALLDIFGEHNYVTTIAIMHNPKGRDQSYVSVAHEYTLMFSNEPESLQLNRLKLSKDEVGAKYPKQDQKGRYRELPLRRRGTASQREDRPYMYFPFVANADGKNIRIIPKTEYDRIFKNRQFDDDYVNALKARYESEGCKFILPMRDDGSKGRWRWGYARCIEAAVENLFFITGRPSETIYVRDYVNDTFLPKSLWFGERHDASTKGTNILKNIIPSNQFDYPKSIYSVEDFLEIGSGDGDVVLDFFAGSGTTGHAAFNLARRFGQKRQCVLVEGGTHSESVTLERLRKAAYSNEWKKGRPIGPSQSLSCAIKCPLKLLD